MATVWPNHRLDAAKEKTETRGDNLARGSATSDHTSIDPVVDAI
jgi:hypothetical protein